MKKKQEIDSEITPTALEEISAVKEEVVPPAEEAPAKKARRKKTKKEEASPKEESLAPEAPVEEAISAQDEQAAEEQTEESDPYAPYRYRWTVKQKDLVKFSYRHALTAVVAVILALGLVVMGILGVIRLTEAPTASLQGGDAPAGDVVLKPLAPQKPENALSVQEMIAKVKPSVVCIDVVKKDNTTGVASGLIVSESGYIITNRHVVVNATSIEVHLPDSQTFIGSVIGSDELSDIAVLRIKDAEGLVAAELGDSALVHQGDWVVAIGTPGGIEFSASATLGIVSGTERRVQMNSDNGASKTFTVIQTDASINPGNSGGPLVNVYGQVIGINSMKLSSDSYESVGFALPINGVIAIANKLIADGRVNERPENDFVVGQAVFGANFEYFTPHAAEEAGLVAGAYVKTVEKDGPAEKAGVKMGDIITSFDGRPVESLAVITEILSEKQAGDVVKIEFYRDRVAQSLEVILDSYRG